MLSKLNVLVSVLIAWERERKGRGGLGNPLSEVLLLPEFIDMIIEAVNEKSLRSMQRISPPWYARVRAYRARLPEIKKLSVHLITDVIYVGMSIDTKKAQERFNQILPEDFYAQISQNGTTTMYEWFRHKYDPSINTLFRRLFNNTSHINHLILTELNRKWLKRSGSPCYMPLWGNSKWSIQSTSSSKVRYSPRSKILAEVVRRTDVEEFTFTDPWIEHREEMRE
ncbi:hypothetical protein PRIPAC_74871 [Pristionchus pacificus]|uniref:Uncharacterized protein n=1 Tax=Pristionchus pacificus TaxID=54126 RepID=A0A2A6C832_PRIPA|nr:hypothetical protein PRIPAC_74871 [Pristionchus pacificus]|eukprot:PDM74365.1 hypothetical protein PRIPAC_41721 [Pristionchus pacificus]